MSHCSHWSEWTQDVPLSSPTGTRQEVTRNSPVGCRVSESSLVVCPSSVWTLLLLPVNVPCLQFPQPNLLFQVV